MTDSDDDKTDNEPNYDVGYGRPPPHSRFRKGRSGNRKGRPPGSKNLATMLKTTLDQRVVVKEGGKRRSTSKGEAIVRQLVAKSLNADMKAIGIVLGLHQTLRLNEQTPSSAKGEFSEEDRQVLNNVLLRIELTEQS